MVYSVIWEGQAPAPRVLIAEDDATNRLFLQRLLQHYGMETLIACDGNEVLEVLQRETVDVVLMDIQMPKMDGLEASRMIRKGEGAWNPDLPIIVITAFVLSSKEAKDIAQYTDGQVAKPVDPVVLQQALGKVLAGEKPAKGISALDGAPHSKGGDASGIMDHAKTLERLHNDKEFVDKIYEVFLADLDERTRNLDAALGAGNLEDLRKRAHTLKGASTTINADILWQRAFALEMAAKEKGQAASEAHLASLKLAIRDVRMRIKEILGE